jgi:uncharacterized repeat protein (TIGR01451 family)
MTPEDNRIERMNKNLYSRKSSGIPIDERAPISREEYIVKEEWDHPAPEISPEGEFVIPHKKGNLFKKIMIGALIFFFLSSGIALFMFFGGFNVISSQNVDISIVGPVSVQGGEELDLQINIQNKNNTDLETATLIVEYPSGTRSAENITTDFPRYRESLGTILAGKTTSRTVGALLFGEENTTKDIKISVEYQVRNSTAVFTKEKKYSVALGTSPVSIKVDSLKEVDANQETTFNITLTSNSNTTLQNILLVAEYPAGFTFTSASPAPTFDSMIWDVGQMEPGQKKVFAVKGRVEGQDGEERVLHWNVGIKSIDNPKLLQTTFVSFLNSVFIKRPFIGVNLSLDGSTNRELVVSRGRTIKGDIQWKNNLPTKIIDAEIQVKINGTILNRDTIRAYSGGFYRSIDNTIIWTEDDNEKLFEINPGDNGLVSFSFDTFDLSRTEYAALTNQEVAISIDVKGKRVGENNVPETVTSSVVRKVKIASNLALTPRIVHSIGPFTNTGPVPPKVETPTTYTITWTLTNASNNVNNVRATAILPQYVRWLGQVSPATEKVTFNPEKNEILWQAGSIAAKTGYVTAPKQVSFQIEFLPSLGQVETTPELQGAVQVSGLDTFTNTTLQNSSGTITTKLIGDPKYGENTERVVK